MQPGRSGNCCLSGRPKGVGHSHKSDPPGLPEPALRIGFTLELETLDVRHYGSPYPH